MDRIEPIMTTFRYLVLFSLSLQSTLLFGREIAYLDGSRTNQFAYPSELQYKDLNVWQKIGFILAKYDVKITSQETVHIKHESRSKLRELYTEDRQLFFVDYRGNHPESRDMSRVPKEAMMNILFEPPAVFATSYSPEYYDLFLKVFTFHDGLVDGKKFIKFRYYAWNPMREDLPPFHERKLCCGFFGNKRSDYRGEIYTERKRVIRFFEQFHPHEFDFYGPGWENLGYATYKGVVDDKCGLMKHYKFSIAYENTKDVPGYITEKIFDCFQAGVVPVYLGSPTVEREIPSNCFIDRRQFSSDQHLYEYLSSMTEETFNEYLDNIRQFLASDASKLFDQDHFVLSVVNGILDRDLTVQDLY